MRRRLQTPLLLCVSLCLTCDQVFNHGQVPEFISQRRRWLNGALFAAINATVFFFRIWTSGHSLPRKIILQVCFSVLHNSSLTCRALD